MNKITRKLKGIQYKWIKTENWDFIREPIKMRRYFKKVEIQNKRYTAYCFKWYDEYENEYAYALWVFELINGEHKEILHSGHCNRLTKSRLKKILILKELLKNEN